MAVRTFALISPTTELEAVNIMLSAIGESPISSFEEITADVAIARSVLTEVCKAVQLEGWQWNTEDDYPLIPDATTGRIKLNPNTVRVHFNHPQDEELVIRGGYIYDRKRHSFLFPSDYSVKATITILLGFEDLPESARRYTVIRAARVFQERVVGSSTLSTFSEQDEIRARVTMQGEERRADRPNILTGTSSPTGTWDARTTLMNRGRRYGIR